MKSWEVGRVILSRWRSGVRFGSQKPFGVGGEPPAQIASFPGFAGGNLPISLTFKKNKTNKLDSGTSQQSVVNFSKQYPGKTSFHTRVYNS